MRKTNYVTSEKENSACLPMDATISKLISNIRERMSEPERMVFMYALNETLKTRDNCVYIRADNPCRFEKNDMSALYQSIMELPLRTTYEYKNTKKCINESDTLISSVSYRETENLLLLLSGTLDSTCIID